MQECPARRYTPGNPSCGFVDVEFGTFVRVPLVVCDACWAKNPSTEEAHQLRQQVVKNAVESAKRDLKSLPPVVALTVMGRHLTKEEAKTSLIEMAPSFPLPLLKAAAEAFSCSDEVYRRLASLTPREQWMAKSPSTRWSLVRSTWSKATSLGKSLTSGRGVSKEMYDRRMASCHGDGVTGACPARKESQKEPGNYYCGECGCGDTALARLDHKLGYEYLECPRAMPGFSNHIEA